MTSTALTRIRKMIRAGVADGDAPEAAPHNSYKRTSIPSSVLRWHGAKRAFLATRMESGSRKQKLFRPTEPNSPSKAAAKEEAFAWVQGGDDETVGGNAADGGA